MEATAWERAAILAEVMASANREPGEARDVLGACAHGGRRACGARGALVRYTPHGRATGRAEGTSAALRALAEQALAWGEGPGDDAARSGRELADVDLRAPSARRRWPRWAPRAAHLGFGRVRALPLAERGRPVGALVLFDAPDEALSGPVGVWGRALCRVTAHALSLQRELRESGPSSPSGTGS
ncbi:GAF domain-containing protein [Streptomyces sp. NPDC006422]|uniref:GAF domain-containing protein n=1 Tax=unclassified Streptomyces TaxID=2593676 RepID=UPI0033AA1DB7